MKAVVAGGGIGGLAAAVALHRRGIDVVVLERAGQPDATTAPFSVFLTLGYPAERPTAAIPELVKALIDGAVAAFQAHGDRASVSEVAARVGATTGQPADLIARTLLDDRRAVLGVTDKLLYPRGHGVQWNPIDHLCVAGQVVVQASPSATWTLAGEIQAVEQAMRYGPPVRY